MARPMIRHRWQKHFGEQDDYDFLFPALTELIKMDVLSEFDLEYSGVIDDAIATHKEFGGIDMSDVSSYIGMDELVTLSRGAATYAMSHAQELTDEATNLGFDRALRSLTAMPIDSTAWTGLPRGFVFTEKTRCQLVDLLEKADAALVSSSLSNFEIGQGSGFLRAALLLANVPEPPQDDIWSILNKGAAIASLASFFAPLLKFFRV